MGIVNVTPDSFSDGGAHADRESGLAHAQRLLEEGADLLDIGGESTRPGASPVPAEEEIRRVVPVLERLAGCGKPLSIDTRKSAVMRAALGAGATMINDIEALRAEGAMEIAAASEAAVCLVHMQGQPESMQQAPHYDDVVAEVHAFLAARVAACRAAGIRRERLVVDPGFGFGKTLEHNLALLRALNQFNQLGVPVLAGLSRKGALGKLTGRPVEARIHASVAAALAAVARGAAIVRVHDVAATVDALRVWTAVGAIAK
jgi:dihydropteroate synthase